MDEELQAIQGFWRLVYLEFNGEEVQIDLGSFETSINGKLFINKSEEETTQAKIEIKGDKTPKQIDFTYLDEDGSSVESGELKGIYKIVDESLSICVGVISAIERPEVFLTQVDSGLILYVFEKTEERPAEALE